jgi:hypothetical protein
MEKIQTTIHKSNKVSKSDTGTLKAIDIANAVKEQVQYRKAGGQSFPSNGKDGTRTTRG